MTKSADKILIFGNGQIGNFYLDYFNNETGHKATMSKADVTDFNQLEEEFNTHNPDVVINAAAKTNLEWIDAHRSEAVEVNTIGADNLAQLCDENNVYYIFLSSGCIFESVDSDDAKTETEEPSPQAFYSWTKVWAEDLIQWKKSDDFEYMILRPRQPISSKVNHKNMLIKLLTFTQYIDTPNTGTVIEDLMGWTNELMEKRFTGVIHVANEGWSTPYRIAQLLKEHVLPDLPIEKITKAQLDAITPVKRVDTILNVDKLKGEVSEVRKYEDALEDTIIKLAQNFEELPKEHVERELKTTYEQTKQRATPNEAWRQLFENK